MPRYSAAYSGFVKRLLEIEALLRLARTASRDPTPRNLECVDALCRAAVVLLCSHIEGYVEDLGAIALDRIVTRALTKTGLSPRFRYHASQDIIDAIRDTSDPTAIAQKVLQLMVRDHHIWGSASTFTGPIDPERFSQGFSNPTSAKVVKYWRRFGYEDFERDVARQLRADFDPCWNMVDQVVEQRNRIAHGEMVTVGAPSDVDDMKRLVKLFCRTADEVVGSWFNRVGCTLR